MYAIRCNAVVIAILESQRPNDRRSQIDATSDRLDEHDLRPHGHPQLVDCGHERIDISAETCPRDFSNVIALGQQPIGVDQITSLIVGHNRDVQPLLLIAFGKPGNCGGLSGAQEAADNDEANQTAISQADANSTVRSGPNNFGRDFLDQAAGGRRLRLGPNIVTQDAVLFSQVQLSTENHRMRPARPLAAAGNGERAHFLKGLRVRLYQ